MKSEYDGNIDCITLMLKHIMLDKGMRQKDIAQQMGLSVQTISNLLNCRRDGITLDTLQRLCNAIDCKLYIDIK